MRREFIIERDLLHLQDVLFDLHNYKFDLEISQKISELNKLVDDKIYNAFNLEDSYILDNYIKIRFFKEK